MESFMPVALKRAFSISLILICICVLRARAYDELHLQSAMNAKKQPDVLADTVTRTERPGPVPVLLVVRHSNLFPVLLQSVLITAADTQGAELGRIEIPYDLKLKRPWWHEVRDAPLPDGFSGEVAITVEFRLLVRDKPITVINNNRRDTRRMPLRVFVNAPPLPRFDNWHYGDPHFHTLFSDNQAEFGAPVDFSARMADLFGLDWLAFTDHSFDLDDAEGDTLVNDPALPRWERYKQEIAAAAAGLPDLLLVRGEELSCGNAAGQNVHMLTFNNERLYTGNGDGFEGVGNAPDHPCAAITDAMPPSEAAFAAHPRTDSDPVSTYALNRGQWEFEDMISPSLSGLQVWNHTRSPWPDGLDHWKRALLAGHRKPLLGGSDAHGDFNYEHGRWPEQLPFGNIRTAVHVNGPITVESLLSALKAGRAFATSGPAALLEIINTRGESVFTGGEISGGPFAAAVYARSTAEFGPVKEIRVLIGDAESGSESLLTTFSGVYAPDPLNIEESVLLPQTLKSGYIRIEVFSERNGEMFEAYTNPVWFSW
jgi:hypothetical protein